MTASTLGVGIVLVDLLWSGVIATNGLQNRHRLFMLVCGPACLVMIVEMLAGFTMYSGRARRQTPPA